MLIRSFFTTVRLMSKCKQIVGNIFVTSHSTKLKITSIIWRLRRTLRRNFNLISQQIKNFPIDLHCKNCPLSATLWHCRKRGIFTMGVYGEILYLLSGLNEISPQSLSKTFKWSRWVWAWLSEMLRENSFAWYMRRTIHLVTTFWKWPLNFLMQWTF